MIKHMLGEQFYICSNRAIAPWHRKDLCTLVITAHGAEVDGRARVATPQRLFLQSLASRSANDNELAGIVRTLETQAGNLAGLRYDQAGAEEQVARLGLLPDYQLGKFNAPKEAGYVEVARRLGEAEDVDILTIRNRKTWYGTKKPVHLSDVFSELRAKNLGYQLLFGSFCRNLASNPYATPIEQAGRFSTIEEDKTASWQEI